MVIRPSKNSVVSSSEPPPPLLLPLPRPLDEDEEEDDEDEDEDDDDEEVPPGVVPETTGVPHADVPAEAGASDVALVGVSTMLARSMRPTLSVTVTCTVTEPLVGAARLAVAVFAPEIAGGLVVGAVTTQAYEAIVRPQEAALPFALSEAF